MSELACLNSVSRLELGLFPTPLHPLSRLSGELGCPVYIKRDDLNGLGPGGNKIRSLEYLLADAMEQGCDTIFASGPLQSNLCALTAAACARLGLRCVLVLNGARPEVPGGNLLLNGLFGAEIHYLGAVDSEVRAAAVEELCERCRRRGGRPYVIRNGATTGRGALGYVRAIPEMVQQCRELELRDLTIYAPAGNGGVAAGLVLGNALAGGPFRVVVVSVEYDYEETCANIRKTMEESTVLLGVAPPSALESLCRVTTQFRGEGWGRNTRESEQAVLRLARTEGILTEHIYNSKVLVAMEQEVRQGIVTGPVCVLHTGGIGALYTQYPKGLL